MNFKRKLWWAQHRTNVFKYGTILSLVLIVTISIIYFTYSKFTSKNEMTAYETTVEPSIKNDDFIASYIDGEWSNEIPGKNDGYVVDKIVCDNGATGTWDNDEWGINIRNATKKIKCSVFFKQATIILGKVIEDESQIATDDADNNIRYIGANPNNYVYFNCSDYNNQSDATCEKWRIIGVFKNVTKSDGSKEDLVKIIKDDGLGNIIWDYKKNGVGTSTSDYGSNDWTDSQLMMMLNPTDYLKSGYTIDNNIVKDSKGQAIYQNMGSYYNGTSGCKPAAIASGADFTCTSIDFTSTGLKNDSTRNAIESVVWNLGGTAYYYDSSYGLASHWYGYERGTTVYSGNATKWTGKIGLVYPSDYGYATSGGSTTDRAACLAKELWSWGDTAVSNCKNNDYLYKSSYPQWTLAPGSANSSVAFFVHSGGVVNNISTNFDNNSVRPAAFLKSNISITDVGTGTDESPFQLKVG